VLLDSFLEALMLVVEDYFPWSSVNNILFC